MPGGCARNQAAPSFASPSSTVEHGFYSCWVGSNRRYADSLQRRRHNREAEARVLVPRSLTPAERGGEVRRGAPVPVRAWVVFGDQSVQVLGTAVEWTDRAVRVLWTGGGDEQREAWVWASACERLEP